MKNEAAVLKEPIVALMDSGTQWGPIDGTSAISQKINADFGAATAGHIYVAASGDEGTLPNHARATYSTTPAVFDFNKTSTNSAYCPALVHRNVTCQRNPDHE